MSEALNQLLTDEQNGADMAGWQLARRPLSYPQEAPMFQAEKTDLSRGDFPLKYPTRYNRSMPSMRREETQAQLGVGPEQQALSFRDFNVPAWMIDSLGLEPSKNTGNTTIGNVARFVVPGRASGEQAYEDYGRGNIPGAVKNGLLATAEVAAPFVLGNLAQSARRYYGPRDYGLRRGDSIEAGKAIGVMPPLGSSAPAKYGIRPGSDVMDDAFIAASPSRSVHADAVDDILARQPGYPYPRPTQADLYGGPRDANAAVSLSPNMGRGNRFEYGIYKDGKRIGEASGTVRGETVHIGWIGGGGDAINAIGVRGVRALREAIRQDYPRAKIFEGERVSGSRMGKASRGGDTKQSVEIDEWMLPLLGAGSMIDNPNQLLME